MIQPIPQRTCLCLPPQCPEYGRYPVPHYHSCAPKWDEFPIDGYVSAEHDGNRSDRGTRPHGPNPD